MIVNLIAWIAKEIFQVKEHLAFKNYVMAVEIYKLNEQKVYR